MNFTYILDMFEFFYSYLVTLSTGIVRFSFRVVGWYFSFVFKL